MNITDRSKAIRLLWFLLFQVLGLMHLMYVFIYVVKFV